MSSIYDWSLTEANNANADSSINWQEGQLPSTVNNSARNMMTRVAELLVDIGGSITAGGTANALTVTTESPFSTYAAGRIVVFKAAADNSAATTLNANGIGGKAIRKNTEAVDSALTGGEIREDGIYGVIYDPTLDGGNGGWFLVNPSAIDTGALVDIPSINGGPLFGFRNKIINGDFDVANRATSTPAGAGFKYLTDRWARVGQNSTMAFARQEHPLGVSIPPGNPRYFGRFTVASVAGSGNFAAIWQPIEDVRTLAGKTVTATFYAKADAAKNIGFEMYQEFGTGGSPSSDVNAIGAQQCALTTSWQRFDILVAVPSVSGKTRGTDNSDSLQLVLWLDASSAYNARASSIGQQSGTFDLSHVSIVEGDARQEPDPFSPRHLQQEIAICQRYYCSGGITTWGGAATSGVAEAITVYFPVQMREAASPIYTTTHVAASNFPGGSPAINDTADGTHMRCSKVASGSGAASFQFTWTADAEL